MFENATTLQFGPGTFDEALRVLRSQLSPVLRNRPGLLGLALIPSRNDYRITVLSLWNSQACARAVEAIAEYRQAICLLDPLLVNEPLYSVSVPKVSKNEAKPVFKN